MLRSFCWSTAPRKNDYGVLVLSSTCRTHLCTIRDNVRRPREIDVTVEIPSEDHENHQHITTYSVCTIIYAEGAQLLNLILERRTCISACPSSGAYTVLYKYLFNVGYSTHSLPGGRGLNPDKC
jgi:hypothetical protein